MAESKFSAVKTRIRTALILVLILSIVLYLGETAIYAFICLVSLLAQWEFLSLFYPGKEKLHFKILFCGLGVPIFYLPYPLFSISVPSPSSARLPPLPASPMKTLGTI